MHRARAGVQCDRHRLVGLRLDGADGDPEAGLDHRAEHLLVVEDLVVVGDRLILVDAATDHDQRDPVLLGVGGDVQRVGDTRADGGDQDAGRAGHVVDALGHEAGRVLVLGQDEADAGPFQRVDEGQDLTAGNAEGPAAAGVVQASRESVGDADRLGHSAA